MKIKHLLQTLKKTKQQLADYCNITTNTIRTYEKGTHQPPLDTFVKMAEFLNCSLETLAGLDDKNIIDKKMLPEEKQKLIDDILNLEPQNVPSVSTFIKMLNEANK